VLIFLNVAVRHMKAMMDFYVQFLETHPGQVSTEFTFILSIQCYHNISFEAITRQLKQCC
jgi:hypothetical protein